MFLVGFPLLIVPLAIYNIMTFIIPVSWTEKIATIPMISGAEWPMTLGDVLLALALLLLFIEIVKASRTRRSMVDHLLSLLVFVGTAAELALVPQAATSPFALFALICLIDAIAGFSIRTRTVPRAPSAEPTQA